MSYIVPRDKPKRCTQPRCRFMDRDTLDCRLQGKSWESFEEQYEHCPLTEIPTPHGRLIDADEFEREFNNHLLPILVKKYGEEEALKGLHFSFRDCICNIQCQKTVIEGSEE